MQQTILAWVTLAASLVTALATFFLWRVTSVLAVETRRMADATGRPQVVASLLPSIWSTIHFDLEVANTGNATAFDIEIMFEPPLCEAKDREGRPLPFQRVSVLNPGQMLRSYILKVDESFLDRRHVVTCSWTQRPGSITREQLTYDLTLQQFRGASRLNDGEPTVRIAKLLEEMKDQWGRILKAQKRLPIDVFTTEDRDAEETAMRARLEEVRQRSQKGSNE